MRPFRFRFVVAAALVGLAALPAPGALALEPQDIASA